MSFPRQNIIIAEIIFKVINLFKKLLLIFCLGFELTAAKAQYRFDHWTVDEGLPQNSVYTITQTPDGYLWLTSFDGLVRFDGVRFTVFNKSNLKTLPSNRFISLLSETDGTIWAGTDANGLIRYKNGQVQTFTTSDGLPSNLVSQIQKDLDGSLLFITSQGLARWRAEELKTEWLNDPREKRIYVSPRGTRWELDAHSLRKISEDGSSSEFLIPFDNKEIAVDRTNNYLSFVSMYEDQTGAFWFSASGNLYKLKGEAVSILTAKDGMPKSLVRDIAQDSDGKIWIGTEKDGICQLNENNFTCYDKSKGLSSNFVRDIFLDREGTLWVTTDEGGINRLTKQIVSPLSVANGLLNKNVYPIFQDRTNNIWIGSVAGLSQFKERNFTNYTLGNPLLYENITAIEEDRHGRLWLGAVGGVQYLQKGRVTDFVQQSGFKVGEADFLDIHEDRQGVLWFASNKGLIKFQDGLVKLMTTKEGLPSNESRMIYERKDGTLLIATHSGLAILRNGEVEQIISEKDGLAGNFVRSIYEDAEGVLWFGTYDSGLSRFKDGKFTNYTTANGMFSNGVFAIQEDSRGNFWMSSNQGIYRVSRQELTDFAEGKIAKITSTAFGKSDGMLNAECNGGQPSSLKLPDGKIWFPTQDGVAIIDPEAVPFNPNPPPVVIESAVLSGIEVDLKDKLEIQPSQDNLEIRYTGLSFIKPEQTRFRYKMEGLDENWTEAGTRRQAYYPYLPPGDYTFRVVAANSDGVWNETGKSLQITVLPPFYRTWWFMTLVALAVIAVILLIFWWRISELNRKHAAQAAFSRRLVDSQEQERKRFAAELHDGLGQSLVIVKNLARLSLKQPDNQTAILEHLERISSTASQAIEETREIAFNLRPHLLDRLGLTRTIESMLDKVFSAGGIEYDIRLDLIDGVFANQSEILFYRIVQECASNIVKHSGASQAKVVINRKGDHLSLIVSDNGCGFDRLAIGNDLEKQGFGLTGISERARLLGGKLNIESEVGKGTTIQVHFDFQSSKYGS